MSVGAAVVATHRRLGWARAVRFGTLGLGVGAGLASLGLGWAPAILGLVAVAGWLTRPTMAQAAQRLDAAVSAEGAVLCAFDHRATDTPMAAAQRRRAEARLAPGCVQRAAPAPGWGWWLLPALWIAPIVMAPPTVEVGASAPPSVAANDMADAGVGPAAPSTGEARAATPDAGIRAAARPNPPDGGVVAAADAGGGGGPVAGRSEVGGEGTRAGDQRAMPVGAERVGLSPGTAAGLWLARAGGEALPTAAARATAPVRGRSPAEDDISDPARPFPPRYRPVIEAWFRRAQ